MTEIEQLLYEAMDCTYQEKINRWFERWSDHQPIQVQMASTCELMREARRQADLRRNA